MKTLWLMYLTEAKLSAREFSTILFGLLMPVGLMLLLGVLFGDAPVAGHQISQVFLSFPAVATIGLCATGLMTVPLALSEYRGRKILKRYRVTPVSPVTLLLAHMLYCFSLSILSTSLVYLVAAGLFGFSFRGLAVCFIPAYFLVMFAMHAIGLMIASLAPNAKTAGVVCSLLYFPMLLLSGATIPYEILPPAMRSVADFMPLTQGIQLLKTTALGEPFGNPALAVTVLLAVTVIGGGIAVKFFQWE